MTYTELKDKLEAEERTLWIRGFIHQNDDEAILGNVHIVNNIRFYAGEYIGYMYISNSNEIVMVKRHPCGTLNGQIIEEW